MTVNYCTQCGTPLPPDAAACPRCGTAVADMLAVEAPTPPPRQPAVPQTGSGWDGGPQAGGGVLWLYTSPAGRVNRLPYWVASIPLWLVNGAVESVVVRTANADWYALTLATAFASLMLSIKRAHDRGYSGWFVLLSFIPLVNLWVLVELGFLRGTRGPNRYGTDPLAPPPG